MTSSMPGSLTRVTSRDLTDPDQQARVLALADEFVADPAALDRTSAELADSQALGNADPVIVEAVACAHSANRIRAIATPVHISIVWAMFRETERILRRDQHEHGEDFLFEKLRQIEWLADHNSLLTWDLVAVDDGCPATPSSGDVAQRLVTEADLGGRVRVLRLADAIDQQLAISDGFAALTSTDDSRKGGSIAYGMWAAISGRGGVIPVGAEHVVIYTDADLSTNLAQAGSLVLPVLRGASAAAGQRYGVPGAVLVKETGAMGEPDSTGTKPDKMIVLFRHYVRAVLVPQLAPVLDTQAGFKALRSDVLAAALSRLDAFTETFDVELLLHAADAGAADAGAAEISPVPIVFTEDFAATNFPSIDPAQRHLDMLHQIVDIHDRLVAPSGTSPEAREMRDFVATLDLDGYVAIIEGLRASDRARTGPDPLFSQRWELELLRSMTTS